MKHRANLHVTRLFLVENNLQKEAKALVGNLKHWYVYSITVLCIPSLQT